MSKGSRLLCMRVAGKSARVSLHMIKAPGGGRRLPFVLEQSEKNPLCTPLLTMSALVTVTSVRVSARPRRDTGAPVRM